MSIYAIFPSYLFVVHLYNSEYRLSLESVESSESLEFTEVAESVASAESPLYHCCRCFHVNFVRYFYSLF